MRQFQCVPATYVTEIKETYFEMYTKEVSLSLAFLSITFQTAYVIANCLYMYTQRQ